MRICNVMSVMPPSGIFCDILNRMNGTGSIVSVNSPPDYDLYVYWRGHWTDPSDIRHPSINYVHCDLTDDIPFDIGIQSYKDVSKFDYHLCICNKQKNDLIDFGVDPAKIHVIHHGYDPRLLKVVRKPSDKLRIGFFSNRYDRMVKGEIELYKLIKEYLLPYRDKIAWYWYGSMRDVEHMIASEYRYESNIVQVETYSDIIKAYENIDVLLILSEAEGGPAVFPEALAAGACVLATKVGMIPDCGYGMSRSDIRQKLTEYAIDKSMLPTQTQIRASLPVETWETQFDKYKDFYNGILAK